MVLHDDDDNNNSKRPSRNDASESWDDDFEFQSAAPTPSPAAESWDDAYEDEDGGARVTAKRESDVDTASWGSDSDWSGDGDAEDLSHESYTRASSELRSPSPSPTPRPSTHFLPVSHATPSTPRSPTAAAFFARISPVKKWKAREPKSDVARGKDKAAPDAVATPQKAARKWQRKREPTTPSSQHHDTLKRVFSSANLRSSPKPRLTTRPAYPASPATPDLTFSPSSPDIPPPTLLSSLRRKRAPSRTRAAAALTPPLPLVTASTHHLPSDDLTPPSPARRSSLGDLQRPSPLRIPARISRAQRDIRRDMGDVREFAASIEQLTNLQHVYTLMLRDLRATLTPPASGPPPSPKKPRRGTVASPQASPTKPSTPRKFSFGGAATAAPDPFARAFAQLDATYGVWWECAALLVALGDGPAPPHGRPRAVTLGSGSDVGMEAGEGGPPPASPPRWRATTGRAVRSELTQRQLALLRAMLAADAGAAWDPRAACEGGSARAKARAGGMGLRELWRGLRRAGSGESSSEAAERGTVTLPRKQPARRPSLAGIFGMGQRAAGLGESSEDFDAPATVRRPKSAVPAPSSPARFPGASPALALTPDNIRPLLAHARAVGARLNECLGAVREMMGGDAHV